LLAIEEGSTAELGQLFSSVGLFLRYLIAQVLFIAMVVVGLILFVVPGLILITVFGLWPFLIVDLDLGPIEALNKSAEITRGHRWKLFGLYAVLLAVAVGLLIPLNLVTRPLAIPLQTGAGMSAQGAEIILTALNLIITYPILSLSWTKAYRQLLRAAEN